MYNQLSVIPPVINILAYSISQAAGQVVISSKGQTYRRQNEVVRLKVFNIFGMSNDKEWKFIALGAVLV